MTEKRFTLKHFEGTDWAYDNGKSIYTKEMVNLLNELNDENEQLKTDKMILEHNHLPVMERKIEKYKMNVDALTETNDLLNEKIETLSDENEELKQQKSFLKIIDDYFIQYEDGELFNLHKPSDIRSLMYILNRENGYSELQCEYNDLDLYEENNTNEVLNNLRIELTSRMNDCIEEFKE